jgi:hypothetical protein
MVRTLRSEKDVGARVLWIFVVPALLRREMPAASQDPLTGRIRSTREQRMNYDSRVPNLLFRFVPSAGIRVRLIATTFVLAACLPAQVLAQQADQPRTVQGEQGIEAHISNKAMQAMYTRRVDMGEFGTNDVRAGFFINEERDLILVGDLLADVGGPNRRPDWGLQVGPRVYGALLSSIDKDDVFAVSLGGRLSYFLGRNRATALSVAAFYAPEIFTFGNADNVSDVSVQFSTRLTQSTRVYVGYRTFQFSLPGDNDRKVDRGGHVGVAYRF